MNPRILYRVGISSGILSLTAVTAMGQAAVDPTGIAKGLIDVAGKDAVVACILILGLVAGACMWLSWKQTLIFQEQNRELLKANSEQVKVNQELATALTKFATKLDRAKCMAGQELV